MQQICCARGPLFFRSLIKLLQVCGHTRAAGGGGAGLCHGSCKHACDVSECRSRKALSIAAPSRHKMQRHIRNSERCERCLTYRLHIFKSDHLSRTRLPWEEAHVSWDTGRDARAHTRCTLFAPSSWSYRQPNAWVALRNSPCRRKSPLELLRDGCMVLWVQR
jgi:hypothetical protein